MFSFANPDLLAVSAAFPDTIAAVREHKERCGESGYAVPVASASGVAYEL